MLSSSLAHLLERARTGLGLEVEVLDSTLRHLYPDSPTALARMIQHSPSVRQSLLGALADGRPEQLDDAGMRYQVFPLRRSVQRQPSALVAVRRAEQDAASPVDEVGWPELARAIVEADFAASDALNDERQLSRRLLATLRFLRHLVETEVEEELAQSVVQAAAVWFDVDARIFQRDLTGDFVLHTTLPGSQVQDGAGHLSAALLTNTREPVRIGPMLEWTQAVTGSEVVLIPLSVSASPEWVLALIGAIPAKADSLLGVLGRIVGAHLETIRARQRDRIRTQFESLVVQGGAVPELLAVRLIRKLVDMTGAAQASLVLNRGGHERRLVRVTTSGEMSADTRTFTGPARFDPSAFVCPMPLGEGVSATLELRPASGALLPAQAEPITREALRVLQCWLAGAESSLAEVAYRPVTPSVSEFLQRIEEELERAKRFDLRLSLILIGIPGREQGDATSLVQEAVRRELRGSDVLGRMNGDHVGALLTHTDDSGSHRVVSRLCRRLGEAAARLNLSGLTVGHAVFSPECRTAEALLSRAVRDAQPVSV